MSKQDRTHSRTPADAENKFLRNLGKTFAEILGIATDARTTAEGTRSELSKAVASINKELADKGASIKLIVDSGVVDKDGNVQASIIISAINDQSEVKIKADNIVFEGQKLDIKVDATNVEGKLTADQIDATELKVDAANITGKLTAEQIDVTNLKVKAANIEDKLTADQINANDIKAENVDISGKVTANEGKVGEWILGEAEIPYLHLDGTEHKKPPESALYSGEQRYEHDNGFNIKETWLTARGVYTKSRHYSCGVIINDVYYDEFLTGTNYDERTWSGLLEGSNGETVSETWTFVLEDGSSVTKEVCIK